MRRASLRRAMLPLASLFLAACGLLIGIDTDLEVKPADGGGADAPDTSVAVKEASADATIDEAGTPLPRRPPEGTYVYEVSGTEALSGPFPTQSATYGPTTTVSIAYDDPGCFAMTFTLRANYVETSHFCIRGLEVVEDKGTRDQKFSIGSTSTTLTCMPGDVYFSTAPTPSLQTHDCQGKNTEDKSNSTSAFRTMGPYSYVSPDVTASVMGKDVLVRRFHDERLVTSPSNTQSGSNVADWTFSADDGTLLLFKRKIDVTYTNVIGTHYVENVNMTLKERPGPNDAGPD